MNLLDELLGFFRLWRRMRGGKWEHEGVCAVAPVAVWVRVDLWRAQTYPRVYEREDHTR